LPLPNRHNAANSRRQCAKLLPVMRSPSRLTDLPLRRRRKELQGPLLPLPRATS
jgi:hypothetical protein